VSGTGGRRPPIPLSVVTGFLGSGKTTLLNRLLSDSALAGTAVIVNEFGEVGLDQLLVGQADEGIVELSSGCLCCTIRGELVTTLENLLRALDNHRIERLDRVVIETTGLADPAPVLQSVLLHPYLSIRYLLDGVVTVLDAANGAATLANHAEAARQVAVADRIVLTKTDIADPAATIAAARGLNPIAPILDAAKGEAEADRLFGVSPFSTAGKIDDVALWLSAGADDGHDHGHDHHHDHHHHDHDHGGHHHHGSDHDHDVSRHDARIRSFVLRRAAPIGIHALEDFLGRVLQAHGEQLLRIKGIVATTEDAGRPLVVQAAQKLFHPPARLPAWPSDDRRSVLVFIVQDMSETQSDRLAEEFAGIPAPDRADLEVVAANPMAIPGFGGRF